MPPAVDLARLTEFSDGTPEGLRTLIEIFLSDTAETMAALGRAMDERSRADIELLAHRCGGASAACGASSLAGVLFQIESFGREDRVDAACALLPRVQAEMIEVRVFLARAIERQPEP